MRMYRGLLFDLDGVLVDTAKYHYLAWKEIAGRLGIAFSPKDNERLKGVSRMRSLEILLEIGGRKLDRKAKEQYCEEKNRIYLNHIRRLERNALLPGVREFLRDARKKGYLLAVGSASRNASLILDRLELNACFDAVIDGNAVSKAKPDPEVFRKGAQALGLKPRECIVFEDAPAGIEAAHAGGMRAVGIGSREALPEADGILAGFAGVKIEAVEVMLAGFEGAAGNPVGSAVGFPSGEGSSVGQ